jgi:hypothetical protein
MCVEVEGASGMRTKCGARWMYSGKAEEFGGRCDIGSRLGGVPKAVDTKDPSGGGKDAGRGGRKSLTFRPWFVTKYLLI